MTLRTKIFVTVGAVLIFFVVVIVILVNIGKKREGVREAGKLDVSSSPTIPFVPSGSVPSNVPPVRLVTDPLFIARVFAERYGTTSNQSNFSNIADLRSSVTPRFLTELEQMASRGREKGVMNAPYEGVTTRALQVVSGNNAGSDRMTVLVTAQRQETKGNGDPRVFQQKLEATLVRSGESWLVDRAVWK